MSTDYTKPPFGMFGYDDVKNQWVNDKPKQPKEEEVVVTEDKSLFEKLKDAVLPDKEEEVKEEANTEPAVQIEEEIKQVSTTIEPVKEEAAEPEVVAETEGPTKFKWTVPKDTTAVYVNIYDAEGKFIDYYTITKFITLKPGQVLEVVAK